MALRHSTVILSAASSEHALFLDTALASHTLHGVEEVANLSLEMFDEELGKL